jgi:hypothetical protein
MALVETVIFTIVVPGTVAVLVPYRSSFLLKRGEPPTPARSPDHTARTRDRRLRVRCPRCGWEPGKADRWSCDCGFAWNTFETGGVCPGCGRVWERTQCPRCLQWSRHEDWYVSDPEPEPGA